MGPVEVPQGFVATPILQDTMVHILSFLEGMTHTRVLLVTPNSSQISFGVQPPEQVPVQEFQTLGTQLAVVVAPHMDALLVPFVAPQVGQASDDY